MAAHTDRHAKTAPSRNKTIRFALWAAAILFLNAGNGFAYPPATAHFSEATRSLGTGFSRPTGVAMDASRDVFVADYNHNAVKEILAAGGYTIVITLGGGFNTPVGVAVDGSGNVFVADSDNNVVKGILAASGYTVSAGNKATSITLTIRTSSQAARNEKPASSRFWAPVALGLLLLPLAGMKSACRRLRQTPTARSSGSQPWHPAWHERMRIPEHTDGELYHRGKRNRYNHKVHNSTELTLSIQ